MVYSVKLSFRSRYLTFFITKYLHIFIVNPRIKVVRITFPLYQRFRFSSFNNLFYPIQLLTTFLQFGFIKGTLHFFSIKISNFICYGRCMFYFRDCKNLFCPSSGTSFLKSLFFLLVILTLSPTENLVLYLLSRDDRGKDFSKL